MGFGGWKLDVYGFDARSFLKLSRGPQLVDLEDQILMARVDFDGNDKTKRAAAWEKARHKADRQAPTFSRP